MYESCLSSLLLVQQPTNPLEVTGVGAAHATHNLKNAPTRHQPTSTDKPRARRSSERATALFLLGPLRGHQVNLPIGGSNRGRMDRRQIDKGIGQTRETHTPPAGHPATRWRVKHFFDRCAGHATKEQPKSPKTRLSATKTT